MFQKITTRNEFSFVTKVFSPLKNLVLAVALFQRIPAPPLNKCPDSRPTPAKD